MVRYEGQYVAVVGKSVITHGKDAKQVYELAREKRPHDRILIGQVPSRQPVCPKRKAQPAQPFSIRHRYAVGAKM